MIITMDKLNKTPTELAELFASPLPEVDVEFGESERLDKALARFDRELDLLDKSLGKITGGMDEWLDREDEILAELERMTPAQVKEWAALNDLSFVAKSKPKLIKAVRELIDRLGITRSQLNF